MVIRPAVSEILGMPVSCQKEQMLLTVKDGRRDLRQEQLLRTQSGKSGVQDSHNLYGR